MALFAGFGGEAPIIDTLLRAYPGRIAGAREFALDRRVLLLRSPGGAGIDISLAALPYEETAIARAVSVEMLPGCTLRLCSPEDLIVMKMFAGRETDLRDVRTVIVRQTERGLDWDYVETHVAAFAALKEDPAMPGKLRQIREAAQQR